MPWRETDVMTERLQFVAAYQRGGFSMTDLCAQFGIARKTGYQLLQRYAVLGPAGLHEGSRRHTAAGESSNVGSCERGRTGGVPDRSGVSRRGQISVRHFVSPGARQGPARRRLCAPHPADPNGLGAFSAGANSGSLRMPVDAPEGPETVHTEVPAAHDPPAGNPQVFKAASPSRIIPYRLLSCFATADPFSIIS